MKKDLHTIFCNLDEVANVCNIGGRVGSPHQILRGTPRFDVCVKFLFVYLMCPSKGVGSNLLLYKSRGGKGLY